MERSTLHALLFLTLAACFLLCGISDWFPSPRASADEVVLKSGLRLNGAYTPTASLAEVPAPTGTNGARPVQPIMGLDDGLRRTFFSKRLVREYKDSSPKPEKFEIWQRAKGAGRRIYSVGPIVNIEPFDEYGRRTFTMRGRKGPLDVIQGITELTPDWAKVEGISHVWDMRIAPSSIPTPTLEAMFAKQPESDTLEHAKKVARFYLQMKRYEDAAKVLESALAIHGKGQQAKDDIAASLRGIKQLGAQRMLEELKRRRAAGQHLLVFAMLNKFPGEGVAGEILQEVNELLGEYKAQIGQRKQVVETLRELVGKVEDEVLKKQLDTIVAEIDTELSISTIGRLTAFLLAKDDKEMLPTEKLAIAVSGWLLGSNAAVANLPMAISACETRDIIRQYLNDPDTISRQEKIRGMQSQEAASPKLIDLILKHMKPPGELPPPVDGKPGFFELEVAGLTKEEPVRYLVQLPPEYDPYHHYPTIVTLHGPASTPRMQLDWWAGPWPKDGKGLRKGQATRRGYIVVAPQWNRANEKSYGYSDSEHAAVLNSLRDACRRFSIDTDRVFLTGHSTGGEAAWDIGLAHPDLWAGVVPITAWSRRYCPRYWENARNLPLYFVGGEKDNRWIIDNARDLDRYLIRGYNAIVVEYQGRGREHFQEEIQRIFDWMKPHRRDFFPKNFKAVSMRPWDNFFWWVELDGMPPKAMVAPETRGSIAMSTEAKLTATNGINVRTGAKHVTVWISPEILDMDRRVKISVNGKRANAKEPFIRPDIQVLLEDARTRADRKHPFWAKVESSTGR